MTGLLLGWDAAASRQPMGFVRPRGDTPPPGSGLLRDGSDSHMMIVAPTGAGKTRSVVIPNLIEWPGPAAVIDIKGELANTTACYRRDVLGQNVAVIDPWGVTDFPSAGLNPLDILQVPDQELADQSFMLASMLAHPNDAPRDRFWHERAEALIAAVIAAVSTLPAEQATMALVATLLSTEDAVDALAGLMERLPNLPEFAKRGIGAWLATTDVTRSGILSTAQSLVRPLLSPRVAEAMARSTIPLADIGSGAPLTLYFVVPPAKLASQAAVLRLWMTVLLSVLTDRRQRPPQGTLLVLDEVAQLGPMEQVRSIMTLGRAFHCRAMLVFQSYAQLAGLYPDHATLVENAGAVLTFGHASRTMSAKMAEVFGDVSADALYRMRRDELAIKLSGEDTRFARRLDYMNDPHFSGRFTPNPMFSENETNEFEVRMERAGTARK